MSTTIKTTAEETSKTVTITTTKKPTTTTVEETTAVMHDVQTFDTAAKSCPASWQSGQMSPQPSVFNFNDGVHAVAEQLCQLKFLSVCTTPIFDKSLDAKCKKILLLATYKSLVTELSRLAITGAGDQNCIYHVSLMPCDQMDFSEVSDADQFFAKFKILLENIYDKCGRKAIRNKLNPTM
jgi:hypothetical protein